MGLEEKMRQASEKMRKLAQDLERAKAPEGSPQAESKTSMQRVAPMFSDEEIQKLEGLDEVLRFFTEQMKDTLRG